MAGPWEKYQAPQKAASGPWEKYKEPDGLSPFYSKLKGFNDASSGLLDNIMQGMTFGFSDEMTGAGLGTVKAAKNLFEGKDADWIAAYKEAAGKKRAQTKGFAERNPGTALTGEIIGGLMVPGRAVGASVAKAPTLATKIGRGARGGGVAGGLAGIGYADGGLDERLAGGARGATAGTLIGGLVPPVAGGLNKGVNAIRQMIPGTVGAEAKGKMAEAMVRDNLTPDELMARWNRAGPDAVMADVGGENMLGLARSVGSTPGRGKATAQRVLNTRELGSERRINKALSDEMGDGGSFYKSIDTIQDARKTAAGDLYKKAYEIDSKTLDTPKMRELLSRPALGDAYKHAEKIARAEGIKLPPLFKEAADGSYTLRAKPTMEALDAMKQALDDNVSKAYRAGEGKLGNALKGLRNDLRDELDRINPDYRQARNVYAGHSANLEALDNGRKFIKQDAEITEKIIADMTDSERTFFRQGIARAVRDSIESKSWTSDQARDWLSKTSNKRKLMKAFPNVESFHRFAQRLLQESKQHRTSQKVLGGSPTQPRLAEELDLGERAGVLGEFGRMAFGGPGQQLGAGGRLAGRALNLGRPTKEAIAEQLAPNLFGRRAQAEPYIRSLSGTFGPMQRARGGSMFGGAVAGAIAPLGQRAVPEQTDIPLLFPRR